jgi:integrase
LSEHRGQCRNGPAGHETRYRKGQCEEARKLAPATIARRVAALRSVVKLARTLGRITWAIDIPSPRAEAYRDTRGPGLAGWKAMLAAVKKQTATPKGKRDLALLRLIHDLGLRRGEVVALDRADLDLEAGTVAVIGKGKTEKVNLTLNPQTVMALTDWVAARGDWAGPLFVRLDRAARPGHPGPHRRRQRRARRAQRGPPSRGGAGHEPARAAAPGDHSGARPGSRRRAEGAAVQPACQAGDAPEVRRQPRR